MTDCNCLCHAGRKCERYPTCCGVPVIPKPRCGICGGTGRVLPKHVPALYETNTAEENARAWDMAMVPCPNCKRKPE